MAHTYLTFCVFVILFFTKNVCKWFTGSLNFCVCLFSYFLLLLFIDLFFLIIYLFFKYKCRRFTTYWIVCVFLLLLLRIWMYLSTYWNFVCVFVSCCFSYLEYKCRWLTNLLKICASVFMLFYWDYKYGWFANLERNFGCLYLFEF